MQPDGTYVDDPLYAGLRSRYVARLAAYQQRIQAKKEAQASKTLGGMITDVADDVTRTVLSQKAVEQTHSVPRVVNSALPRKVQSSTVLQRAPLINERDQHILKNIDLKIEDNNKNEVKKSKKGIARPKLATIAIVILLMVGLLAGLSIILTNQKIVQQVGASGDTANGGVPPDSVAPGEKPDEKRQDISGYSVGPDVPRFITIDKISEKARIIKLGVDSNNTFKAPYNIYDVGWYESSAKPGDTGGAMLLDGHVSGPTKPGIFKRLGELGKGDTLSVERGDGKTYSFRVVKTETVDADKVDMAKTLVPAVDGTFGLNIITCTGKFDSNTNKYEQRLIVYTQRI